jgi:hypothetical protein
VHHVHCMCADFKLLDLSLCFFCRITACNHYGEGYILTGGTCCCSSSWSTGPEGRPTCGHRSVSPFTSLHNPSSAARGQHNAIPPQAASGLLKHMCTPSWPTPSELCCPPQGPNHKGPWLNIISQHGSRNSMSVLLWGARLSCG